LAKGKQRNVTITNFDIAKKCGGCATIAAMMRI
jgi:hypothetical protein